MSTEVAKKSSSQDVASQPSQAAMMREEKERSAKAQASAGLNLNIFGALSGAFSSKSSKKTEEDGSTVEHKEEELRAKGAGAGHLDAQAQASAEEKGRQMRQQAIQDSK